MKYVKVVNADTPEAMEYRNASKIYIEEKVDGSQFRINITDQGIFCGSKAVDFNFEHLPENMFNIGVTNAKIVFQPVFESGWRGTIFAEYLKTPKQNTLSYERVPKWNFIVFDIFDSIAQEWYHPEKKFVACKAWGTEVVPVLYVGTPKDITGDMIKDLFVIDSILGKEKIEGVVIKQYDVFYNSGYQAGMPVFIKFVRPEFKERNKETWKSMDHKNYLQEIVDDLSNPNRFLKAYIHLNERGEIQNKLQDIAKLVPEIKADIELEEKERLKEIWWKANKDDILRAVCKRVPAWYKNKLIDEFDTNSAVSHDV